MSKKKKIYISKLVQDNKVYDVIVWDEMSEGQDGTTYKIELVDISNKKSNYQTVNVSGTWFSTQNYSKSDFIRYMVQFRKQLRETITTALKNPFIYPSWTRDKKLYEVGKVLEVFLKHFPNDYPIEPGYIRNSVTIEFFEILSLLEFFETNKVIQSYELGSQSFTSVDGWYENLKKILEGLNESIKEYPAIEGDDKRTVEKGYHNCMVSMFNGDICNREVYKDNKCICHYKREKDLSAFNKEIKGILSNNNIEFCDFTLFVFPENFKFDGIKRLKSDILFQGCTFYCYVGLREYVFCGKLKIIGCCFKKMQVLKEQHSGNHLRCKGVA